MESFSARKRLEGMHENVAIFVDSFWEKLNRILDYQRTQFESFDEDEKLEMTEEILNQVTTWEIMKETFDVHMQRSRNRQKQGIDSLKSAIHREIHVFLTQHKDDLDHSANDYEEERKKNTETLKERTGEIKTLKSQFHQLLFKVKDSFAKIFELQQNQSDDLKAHCNKLEELLSLNGVHFEGSLSKASELVFTTCNI